MGCCDDNCFTCIPFIRKFNKNKENFTLAILGLDNAGKTSTTLKIKGDSSVYVQPTVGFNRIEFSVEKYNVILYDLGGAAAIRNIWPSYFAELYGIIFVVDSSDRNRLVECKNVLFELFSHSKITGKPILILANKQDKPSALSDGDILEYLKIDALANEFKNPCRLECCSVHTDGDLDLQIKHGLKWLLNFISYNRARLKEKIERDLHEQAEIEVIEKEERKIRIQNAREARLKEFELESIRQSVDTNHVNMENHDTRMWDAMQLKEQIKQTFEEELSHQYTNGGFVARGDIKMKPTNIPKNEPNIIKRLKAGGKTHPVNMESGSGERVYNFT